MSYKPEALPVTAAPNVIPMADIMLVLLILLEVRAVGVDSIGLLTEKIQQKAALPRGGSD